nr:Scr1 family TA system antitoxin-like transcriptional regulator [Sphaerisporangium corydalis]
MSGSGPGPVVQSALLRTELVRLRRDNRLTQDAVAKSLEWSPSKLIRIEGGKTGITKSDLQALLNEYGVSSPTKSDRLQALARGAKGAAWWDRYKGKVSDAYLTYVGYEAGAAFIRQFQPSVIPGLLQTQEYAQVMVGGAVSSQLAAAVRLRLQRQQELALRDDLPHRYFILDEAVIRRHVGAKVDSRIMPTQLRSLVELAQKDPRLTIAVIPFSAGAHEGMTRGPITVLGFEEGLGDLLYRERGESPATTFDDELVSSFRDIFESLVNEALTPEKSLELIAKTADDLMK